MVNRVQLTGSVQDDPKITKTAEGREAVYFDLLCEASRKNDKGFWEKYWVAYHVVVSKGHIVDWAKASLRKGDSILVEGNLSSIELKEKQGKLTKIAAIEVSEFGGKIELLRPEKSS